MRIEKNRSRAIGRQHGFRIQPHKRLNPEPCALSMEGKPGAGRGSCGFTLIETVVSLPIAAIAFFALYSCFAWGFSIVGLERENLRASQIMVKQLERVRISDFDQLTNTVYNPSTFTDYFDPTDQPNGGGGTAYTVSFTASLPASGTLPDSYRTNMLLVTVGITWNSGHQQHTNWTQSLVALNGMETYVVTGR